MTFSVLSQNVKMFSIVYLHLGVLKCFYTKVYEVLGYFQVIFSF